MTPYESASLVTQWISAVASVLAVLVAVIFGWLTLINNRRSKDAQDRATYAAAGSSTVGPAGVEPRTGQAGLPDWELERQGDATWLLKNAWPSVAYDVTVQGLTELDNRRLMVPSDRVTLEPAATLGFEFRPRLSLPGPGNIVVRFATEEGGPTSTRVLRVPE